MHDDHFTQNEADPIWLRECGRRGGIVISSDKQLEFASTHREAVKSGNTRVLVLSNNNIPAARWAECLIGHRSQIDRLIKGHPAPFIARITMAGDINVFRKIR